MDEDLLKGLEYRCIGPARGGRVTAVEGIPNQPFTFFMGSTGGGVWKTMDPGNARILYAGMWTAERKPWTLIDCSEEGGVWKSTDAGNTWKKLGGGLPEGIVGRVGIAVSPQNSKRVWVLREAKEETKGGLYLSEDGGENWTRINRSHELRQRAWYYTRIYANGIRT